MSNDIQVIQPMAVSQSTQLRREVIEANAATESAYWRLAFALHKVWSESAYLEWGYSNFNEYIDKDLDMQRRKAQYLVSIADWFGSQSEDIQAWVQNLGWTKARDLVGIVNEENAEEWREVAESSSARELTEKVKAAKETAPAEQGDDDKPKPKRFSLFTEQMSNVNNALAAAKAASGSDKDGHALDLICTEYLAQNGALTSLNAYMAHLEQILGKKILVIDDQTGTVEFGAETLDSLFPDQN